MPVMLIWVIRDCNVRSDFYDVNRVLFKDGRVLSRFLIKDGRHFPDDTFECIFLNENVIILIKISLKFVAIGPINNIPALVQIMAWCQPGDKPLSETMMVSLMTHICVTRPEWVNQFVSDNSIQAFLSNNTNIFYLAVGCACAFILMIAVAVAIYYCCANKAARNQRLRYVSQDPLWWK